jgi:hypothetical protein
MDGVLVREEHPIPGADRFLERLREGGAPFLVVTNNSMYTPRDLAARLRRNGPDVPEEAIRTSALSTANLLESQRPGGSAFVIGEDFPSHADRSCAASRTAGYCSPPSSVPVPPPRTTRRHLRPSTRARLQQPQDLSPSWTALRLWVAKHGACSDFRARRINSEPQTPSYSGRCSGVRIPRRIAGTFRCRRPAWRRRQPVWRCSSVSGQTTVVSDLQVIQAL